MSLVCCGDGEGTLCFVAISLLMQRNNAGFNMQKRNITHAVKLTCLIRAFASRSLKEDRPYCLS